MVQKARIKVRRGLPSSRVVEHDDEDAIGAIQHSLRDYPRDLMDSVGNNNAFVLPQSEVAARVPAGASSHSFSSILTFQGLDGDVRKYAEGYVDSEEISSMFPTSCECDYEA